MLWLGYETVLQLLLSLNVIVIQPTFLGNFVKVSSYPCRQCHDFVSAIIKRWEVFLWPMRIWESLAPWCVHSPPSRGLIENSFVQTPSNKMEHKKGYSMWLLDVLIIVKSEAFSGLLCPQDVALNADRENWTGDSWLQNARPLCIFPRAPMFGYKQPAGNSSHSRENVDLEQPELCCGFALCYNGNSVSELWMVYRLTMGLPNHA